MKHHPQYFLFTPSNSKAEIINYSSILVQELISLLRNQFCGYMTDRDYETFCFQMIEFAESLDYTGGNQLLFLIQNLVGVLLAETVQLEKRVRDLEKAILS
ncbi:MAG: hypothetical protein IH840_11150 [Candidatus Heimdallarchaeota archaeon]|nr:hypothetical protein [Candidatus Heimdallarchaeota archaeon]